MSKMAIWWKISGGNWLWEAKWRQNAVNWYAVRERTHSVPSIEFASKSFANHLTCPAVRLCGPHQSPVIHQSRDSTQSDTRKKQYETLHSSRRLDELEYRVTSWLSMLRVSFPDTETSFPRNCICACGRLLIVLSLSRAIMINWSLRCIIIPWSLTMVGPECFCSCYYVSTVAFESNFSLI
jgi:hypothetical protein